MQRPLFLLCLSSLASWIDAAESAGGEPYWSPILVGSLIGLLATTTVILSDKSLGVSTAYARLAGMIARLFAPRFTTQLSYFQKTRPTVDWEVALLFGIVLGAFLAAWTGNNLTNSLLPSTWIHRFGSESAGLRVATAIGGGFLMAIGARIAGGCTSGHGISGTIHMSVGSWVALLSFFIGGMAVALPLFGRGP